MIEIFGGKMEARDWSDFLKISIQMSFLFMLVREKDQNVSNCYERIALAL